VRGDAELLPFRDRSFAGAYATWAYFFSREWDPTLGIEELHRAVRPGGP
jgi:ubiquinone/menaquinone biosynthesis C-methylase UbiE